MGMQTVWWISRFCNLFSLSQPSTVKKKNQKLLPDYRHKQHIWRSRDEQKTERQRLCWESLPHQCLGRLRSSTHRSTHSTGQGWMAWGFDRRRNHRRNFLKRRALKSRSYLIRKGCTVRAQDAYNVKHRLQVIQLNSLSTLSVSLTIFASSTHICRTICSPSEVHPGTCTYSECSLAKCSNPCR